MYMGCGFPLQCISWGRRRREGTNASFRDDRGCASARSHTTRIQEIGIHASTMHPWPALIQPAVLAYHKDTADRYSCIHHASIACPHAASHVGVSQGPSRSVFMLPPCVHGLPLYSQPCWRITRTQQIDIHASTIRPWPAHSQPCWRITRHAADRYSCIHHASMAYPRISQGYSRRAHARIPQGSRRSVFMRSPCREAVRQRRAVFMRPLVSSLEDAAHS